MPRQARSLQVVRAPRQERQEEAKRPAPVTKAPTRRPPARGTLAGLTPEGRVLARLGGASAEVPVSLAVHVPRRVLLDAIAAGAAVLIDFIDGDADQPVVTGLLRDRIDQLDAADEGVTALDLEDVTLRAPRSISLACGESSITLTHTGRVTIRGTEVVNESTGAVKLKGAYVELN